MQLYDRLCELIIRPERHLYRLSELGPKCFVAGTRRVDREDLELVVDGGIVHVSLYRPRQCQHNTCVVYLHSNSGSRLQGNSVKDMLVAEDMPVCTFDFRGSGQSTGEYVSYGYHERTDLQHVLDHLTNQYGFESFVLWGRSMGAATALMYAANSVKHKILLTIADSSYYNLWELLEEIGNKKIGIPNILLKPMLYMFENSIRRSAKFNISDINMEEYMKMSLTPVVFVASKTDSIVPISHSQKLYKTYMGVNKELYYIEEDHQLERKKTDLESLIKLILKLVRKQKVISNPNMKMSMMISKRLTLDHDKTLFKCGSTESLLSSGQAETVPSSTNRSQYKINIVSRRATLSSRIQ